VKNGYAGYVGDTEGFRRQSFALAGQQAPEYPG